MFEDNDPPPDRGSHDLLDRPPPPPCGAKAYRDRHRRQADPEPSGPIELARGLRPAGRRFDAELDCAEIDERNRPGPTWSAKARSLSRSNLTLLSRRMCYIGREIFIAVHLIDDTPTPLFGRVHACEYDAEGLYAIDLDLAQPPSESAIRAWAAERARNGAGA